MPRLSTNAIRLPIGPVKIDWSRAPRGLQAFVSFKDGYPIELIKGTPVLVRSDTPLNGATGNLFSPTQAGMAFNTPSYPAGFYIPAPQFSGGSDPCSFEVYLYFNGVGDSCYLGIHEGDPINGTVDRQLAVASGTNGTAWYIFDGSVNVLRDGLLPSVGLLHIVGVATGTSMIIYVNGVQTATKSASNAGYTGFSSPSFCVGAQAGTSNLPTTPNTGADPIIHAAYANVAWTAEEVKARYLRMYDFIVPVFEKPVSFLASAGALYNQTVTAVCTTTSSISRRVGKILPATCTSTASLIRRTSKTLTATCTSTASLIRTVAKTLIATCTTSGFISAIKSGGTQFNKTVVATCTTTASLTANALRVLLLTATATTTATLIRRFNKTLTATCTTTATATKRMFKTLTATCTSTASVLAHKCVTFTQSVIATCTTSATVSAVKALAGVALSLAQSLRIYKPQPAPVIPGSEVKYLQEELLKVSNAFKAHVEATKSIDARLKAAGF